MAAQLADTQTGRYSLNLQRIFYQISQKPLKFSKPTQYHKQDNLLQN